MTAQYLKPWLQPFKYIRNGKYPDAFMQSEMSELGNHLALFRLQEIASIGMTTTVIASPAAASERIRWRTRYKPSPYATCIIVRAWMAQSTLEDTTTAPYAIVDFDNGTDSGQATLSYGAAATANANPDHCAVVQAYVLDAGSLLAPDSTSEYAVRISDYQSRIVACTIFEGSINATAPFSEGFAATTPIFDVHQRQLITGARAMWKLQAANLFTWSVDDAASPRTRSSATPVNVIDNSSTAAATDKPGFTIDLRNRARTSTGTVPVKFWAYGTVGAGSGGSVILKDSTDTTVATISSITGWASTTANLPATRAKYDVLIAGDGTNTFSLGAVHLTQYQSGS